jgi:hypothetical protein
LSWIEWKFCSHAHLSALLLPSGIISSSSAVSSLFFLFYSIAGSSFLDSCLMFVGSMLCCNILDEIMGHIQNFNRVIKLEGRLLSCHQLNRCQGYGMAFLNSMCRKGTGTSLNQKASSFFHYGEISVTEQFFSSTDLVQRSSRYLIIQDD